MDRAQIFNQLEKNQIQDKCPLLDLNDVDNNITIVHFILVSLKIIL